MNFKKNKSQALAAPRSKAALPFKQRLSKMHIVLYLMVLPTVAYVFIFNYLPLGGLVMAFKNYNSFQGIWKSPWADMHGWAHFYNFVTLPNFWDLIRNTLVLSCLSIFFNTICPIFFALFLHEVKNKKWKRLIQTVMYAPYFISGVVVVAMLFSFFDYDSGILTNLFVFLGMDRQNLMQNSNAFAVIYVLSGLWQGLGWWAIIYFGTLANVDPALHESAMLEGAGRLRRIFSINLPEIMPMAIIMFILSLGNILNVGFEKVYLMQTADTLSISEIISTYVYRVSFISEPSQYSYATAIGLFNSAINIVLLVAANAASKKLSETSLW